jgi:peptidoglycan/xylan/chitin deacetylase (PgdA/CDA1 family)
MTIRNYTRQVLNQLRAKVRRTLSTKLARRIIPMHNEVPLVSFTFDDFPHSAWSEGGAILEDYGIRGTFFASFGLVDSTDDTSKMFSLEDVHHIMEQKHELGCHTYDHYNAWDTSCSEFEASILRNREALKKFFPDSSFKTLAYPISCPRPEIKRRMMNYFECCRAGGQTFNVGSIDLGFVKACFLEKTRNNFDFVARLIELNNQRKGWLVFATHDISQRPTDFGCTPTLFKRVVRYAAKSGARILPVCEALDNIRGNKLSELSSPRSGSTIQRIDVNVVGVH